MEPDPNRRPFQRGSFVERLGEVPGVHIRRRNVYETYFREKDALGFQHDLGAQDVFLDNLGIVFREQLVRAAEHERYLAEVGRMLHGPWEDTRRRVLRQHPWWGVHINANRRRAAAGEPRPRLRLLTGRVGWPEEPDELASGNKGRPLLGRWPGALDDLFEPVRSTDPSLLIDRHEARPHGIVLPEYLAGPVKEGKLLPILHCTPDLPARVGVTVTDRRLYGTVLGERDQGVLKTCASFATVFALEIAARKSGFRPPRLSPAWLHLATGDASHEGRTLDGMVERLRHHGLPCSEDALPYQRLVRGEVTRFEKLTENVHQDQARVAQRLPEPEIVAVPHDDISLLKTLLAAGWVLLLTTRITDGFQANAVAMSYGVPLLPLYGSAPTGGHAWCVVGYDHVDGSLNWKYQGRFVALNSWGPHCHKRSVHGPGTLSLPFAFIFQEGFAAFAVRFPDRP